MKIVVCGGDGFCGWPTSLHLSSLGHEVFIFDNLSRRKIDIDLEVDSLTPISSINDRINAWKEVTGREIIFKKIDIALEYDRLLQYIDLYQPDAVIHFAEQRSAPFSMKDSVTKRYTVDNNVRATHNLLCAIVESGLDIHLIHLGTTGVYGYTNNGLTIPEGYLPVSIETDDGSFLRKDILYPANAGSVYHMTKTLDQLLFDYYIKNNKLRITDLHQGIVWGTQTKDTVLDERLLNRFDYDGDYGTVLNRFLLQSAFKYPLTVHGTGGQTRAFIHISNTIKCLELSVNNPPKRGDRVLIRNQLVETYKVRDLAIMISKMTGAEIKYIPNPRNEDAENELKKSNKCFLDLGLEPVYLHEGLFSEILDVVNKYSYRCDLRKIPCVSCWDLDRKKDVDNYLSSIQK